MCIKEMFTLEENLKHIGRQAIFFDFDGTLVNSANVKLEAFFEIYNSYGFLNEATRRYLIKKSSFPRVLKLEKLQEISRIDISIDQIMFDFDNILKIKLDNADLIPGSYDYLRRSRYLGIPMFLISAAPEQEVVRNLKKFNLQDCFEKVVCDCYDKSSTLEHLINLQNIDIKYSRYFGDSEADYIAAKDNGVRYMNIGLSNYSCYVKNFLELI